MMEFLYANQFNAIIEMLEECEDLKPVKMTEGSVGYDIKSKIDCILYKKRIVKIPCGFKIQLPAGYEAQIRPRSSFGVRGIIMPNSPGTIDTDYRGEVSVLLTTLNDEKVEIKAGERIAQMVISKVYSPSIVFDKVDETFRGENGFGSTGKIE